MGKQEINLEGPNLGALNFRAFEKNFNYHNLPFMVDDIDIYNKFIKVSSTEEIFTEPGLCLNIGKMEDVGFFEVIKPPMRGSRMTL